jgi:hypothetical protein
MKRSFRFLSLFIISALFTTVTSAFAQGTAFTYQGRLNDNSQPANGSYDLTFTLFSASNGGSQVGNTFTNAATPVASGLFTATLDFGSGVFTGSNLWLEVAVRTNGSAGGYTTLTPRQPILPTPYAILANTANNLAGPLPATNLSGTVGNDQLANSSLTVNAGPGLIGGGTVPLGSSITLSNDGLLSITGNVEITASTSNGVVKLGSNATRTNLVNTIVKRDASGSFGAGSISLTGAVTASDFKLVGGSQSVVTSLSATRIVWGGLNGDGSVAFGTGFTVSRSDVGIYTVIFSPPFNTVPAVLFSPPYSPQTPTWTSTFTALATNSVVIRSWNSGAPADAGITFLAIGPR